MHNEGSMQLSIFESKLRSFYYSSLRVAMSSSKKRDEVISLSRLIEKKSLIDKIERYSFVDEINVSFTNTTTANRFLNSSVYNKTKTVRLTMRTNNLPIKSRKEKNDLVKYLDSLTKASGKSISFKGKDTISSEGETVTLIDKASSIETLEHYDYLKLLHGTKLSAFVGSGVYHRIKNIVLSHNLTK